MGCAEPKHHKSTCTKVKGVCPACITYSGDQGSIYLPEFFIEVTNKWGKSMFDSSPVLSEHLDLAKEYYESKNMVPGFPSGFTDNGGLDEESGSYFWHARIISTPYNESLIYPYVKVPGSVAPICFSGLSEFVFDQWHLGESDDYYTNLQKNISMKACMLPGSSALGASGSIIPDGSSSGFGCAHPVGGSSGRVLNAAPTSDSLNLTSMCMGELGSLLPRVGRVLSTDKFRSAISAAWKFSSLTRSLNPMSQGGMRADYKWQMVYPKSSRTNCFYAGSISDHPPAPMEYRGTENTDTYVFAIWKNRKTSCLEPYVGYNIWKGAVDIEHQAFTAICKAVSI